MFFNLLVTMTVSGLWHGANWTFVVWGCYHGLFLSLDKLAALPDERFSFAVTRINPTTEVRDGATVYRVEAELTDNTDMLGVGLEGVARIYVDERLLVSIWTRGLVDWLKLQSWRFWG